MTFRFGLTALLAATLMLGMPLDAAHGQMKRELKGGRSGGPSEGGGRGGLSERMQNKTIAPTGLYPAFPAGQECPPISSPFGSNTRYDGSERPAVVNGGRHGGMDVTLVPGTPLLAMADGEIVHKGEGGQMEGIYLWIRHAPQDTGFPFWVFSKYQHLQRLPDLPVGSRVTAGQAIAIGGDTGTEDGHFGSEGYAHLHVSSFFGPSANFELMGTAGSMVKAEAAVTGDPMALYLDDLPNPDAVPALPDVPRAVPVGIVDRNGNVLPSGSRKVWPLACH